MHSDNLQAPFLGQQVPDYPALPQILRSNGVAVITGIYQGWVEQFSGTALRDREQCYLFDANNAGIFSQYYFGRLIGNYLGLPLFGIAPDECCNYVQVFAESSGESDVSPGYYKAELYDRNGVDTGLQVRASDINNETLEPGLYYRACASTLIVDGFVVWHTNVVGGGGGGDCGNGCAGWEGAFTDFGPFTSVASFASGTCIAVTKNLDLHLPAGSNATYT